MSKDEQSGAGPGTSEREGTSDEWVDPIVEWVPLIAELDNEVQDAMQEMQWVLATANMELARVDGSERTILTHFFNDVLLFLSHTAQGDGRSAARTARSLFEHLVNYATVTGDTVESDRYAASRYVTADRLSLLCDWWLRLLDGKQKQEERRRLRRLARDAAGPLAEASARFDTPKRKYVNNVFSDNLHRRAEKHGKADDTMLIGSCPASSMATRAGCWDSPTESATG